MKTIESIDSRGSARWTPVPDGYTVERVIEILAWAGHTEITTAGDAAA